MINYETLLQNATDIITKYGSYFITKYVRFFITKCDRFITKCDSYYKLRQFYHKMRQLLQNATFITNCDSTMLVVDYLSLINVFIKNTASKSCIPMSIHLFINQNLKKNILEEKN